MTSNNFDIKYIYDIFHNDNNKIVIIMPPEFNPPNIKYINSNENVNFKLHICPHKHTFIYELLLETEYNEKIQLLINNKIFDVKVNKYPEFKNEIIMSTLVYNEDNYIRQWIQFHLNIGVTRFIIYDNSKINDHLSYKSVEKNSDLNNLLSDFIEKGIVLLIEWTYPKRLPKSGISGQTTQQNHSIYAFRNSKYIGLFDIDEYINIQNNTNIHSFFDELVKDLQVDTNNIGSFRLLNKFFHNPDNLSVNQYDFLSIITCNEITKHGREKNFVIPKNVKTFAVHMITNGKQMYNIDSKYVYFNHYCFLNKASRGRDKCVLLDKTILTHCNFIQS
tara:strand:- start:1375 stop:2373 length:999 start_codon:yes stop_codon:yes gene_type:complete